MSKIKHPLSLVILSLALHGCGSDDSSTSNPTNPTPLSISTTGQVELKNATGSSVSTLAASSTTAFRANMGGGNVNSAGSVTYIFEQTIAGANIAQNQTRTVRVRTVMV